MTASRSESFEVAGQPAAGIMDWPGIRTFRSRRFRVLMGLTLWLIGAVLLGALLAHQVRDPRGEFAIDFMDYRAASLRMLEGRSPYAPEMLVGPIEAQGTDRYRYPPPFAQAIAPLAALPLETGAWIWAAGGAVLIFASVWLAAGAAGANPSIERFIWTGVASTYFLPTFNALLMGNVSFLIAFSFALLLAIGVPHAGGLRTSRALAGGVLGAAVVLKLTPITVLPAAFRFDRRLTASCLVAAGTIAAVSFAVAPGAWIDYAHVLPNLLAGSADYPNNLAPAVVGLHLGLEPWASDLVRLSTLVVSLALMVIAIWLAGRRAGWPAAVACGVVAGLLLPAAIWYQYLTVLLPVVAFAWVKATPVARWTMAIAASLITAALAWLPLATLSGGWLAGTIIYVLWPRESRSASPSR